TESTPTSAPDILRIKEYTKTPRQAYTTYQRRTRSNVVVKIKQVNSRRLSQPVLPERRSASMDRCGEGTRCDPTESGERPLVQGIPQSPRGFAVDVPEQ